MPTLSLQEAILNELQGILVDADPFGIDAGNIVVRELPKRGEQIDLIPAIYIAPDHFVEHDYFGMESTVLKVHHIEIALVDAANGDFATNQDQQQAWEEAIIRATEVNDDTSWRLLMTNVPQVYSIQTERVQNFDRSELNENYVYLPMIIKVYTNET